MGPNPPWFRKPFLRGSSNPLPQTVTYVYIPRRYISRNTQSQQTHIERKGCVVRRSTHSDSPSVGVFGYEERDDEAGDKHRQPEDGDDRQGHEERRVEHVSGESLASYPQVM